MQEINSRPTENAFRHVLRTPSVLLALASPATLIVPAAQGHPSTNVPVAHQTAPSSATVAAYLPAAGRSTSIKPPPHANPVTRAAQAVPDLVRVIV